MKKTLFLLSVILNLLLIGLYLYRHFKPSPITSNSYPPYYYKISPVWKQLKTMYDVLPYDDGKIVFFGNSIIEDCSWSELLQDNRVINRGIQGDDTEGMLSRVDQIIKLKPSKVFILSGTNDLSLGYSDDKILNLYKRLTQRLANIPIYIISIPPTNIKYYSRIPTLNNRLRELCADNNCTFIDIYSSLADKKGYYKSGLSNDGIHLLGNGYLILRDILTAYLK